MQSSSSPHSRQLDAPDDLPPGYYLIRLGPRRMVARWMPGRRLWTTSHGEIFTTAAITELLEKVA